MVIGAAAAKKGVIESGLNDLLKSAQANRSTMWVIVPVEAEVTPGLDRVLTWAFENEVEYHVYRPSSVDVDEELEKDATEVKVSKSPTMAAIKALVKVDGADAALVLFEEDSDDLVDWMGSANDAGLRLLELSDGLEPIAIAGAEAAVEEEPEEVAPAP